MSRKPILGVYFIMGAMVFLFERFFFQISQGSTAHGILRKQQVPHPMETIKVEHSREIWSKTTAWAGHGISGVGDLDDGWWDNQLGATINDKRKSTWEESEETYNKSASSAPSPA